MLRTYLAGGFKCQIYGLPGGTPITIHQSTRNPGFNLVWPTAKKILTHSTKYFVVANSLEESSILPFSFLSFFSLAQKLEDPTKLLVAMYAWDSNSFPGLCAGCCPIFVDPDNNEWCRIHCYHFCADQ